MPGLSKETTSRALYRTVPVKRQLETQAGKVLAHQSISGMGPDWKKFELTLSPGTSDTNARLVVSFDKPGTVWLDMVSLFPAKTWKNLGLRPDLAQMMANMHPGLLRFPGGSFSEGHILADAWRWKETIGDVAQRPGSWNIWGYRSSNGLGFLDVARDMARALRSARGLKQETGQRCRPARVFSEFLVKSWPGPPWSPAKPGQPF